MSYWSGAILKLRIASFCLNYNEFLLIFTSILPELRGGWEWAEIGWDGVVVTSQQQQHQTALSTFMLIEMSLPAGDGESQTQGRQPDSRENYEKLFYTLL